MKCFLFLLTMVCASFVHLGLLETARAAVAWTGNIDPVNPASWTTSTDGYVGKTADGTLTVDGNSDLLSRYAHIGHDSGIVGHLGNGTLTIDAGGLVRVEGKLTIDSNGGDDSYINMATGGILAIFGNADDSLGRFPGTHQRHRCDSLLGELDRARFRTGLPSPARCPRLTTRSSTSTTRAATCSVIRC